MKDTKAYSFLTQRLREFFQHRGYIEVPTQSRLSILAACEDPKTISTVNFAGMKWPLPQTGQMWLEYELLTNPDVKGVFCSSYSYRNEPKPIPGRHDLLFPMFEFEGRGGFRELGKTITELLADLGFINSPREMLVHSYDSWCAHFSTTELTAEHEMKMWEEGNDVVGIQYFPEKSHPFWNMKFNEEKNAYEKVDVILYGMETIGSAVRETDSKKMSKRFSSISGGQYKKLLVDHFGTVRVINELSEYLSLNMTPRYGAGIGLTRLARAYNQLKANPKPQKMKVPHKIK